MREGTKRRHWSDVEKLEICGQARVPGVSVAQVARRYALNANMLHGWLRDPRYGGDEGSEQGGVADVLDRGACAEAAAPFYEVSVSSDAPSGLALSQIPAQMDGSDQRRELARDQRRGLGPSEFTPVGGGKPQEPVHALRVDLALSDGRRVLIEGAMSLATIVGLVEGLTD